MKHTLIVGLIGLRLWAQTPADEQQQKARLAAERQQRSNSAPGVAPVGAGGQPPGANEEKRSAEAMHAVISGVGGSGPVVKDKPYSAETFTVTTQTLADGNRILRENTGKIYRDSSGRTRRDQTIATLSAAAAVEPLRLTVISDPVASADYILDPDRRTVRKFARYEVAPVNAPRESENLGRRRIEGLDCTGTRATRIVPAGAIGNERPIVITTESWTSQALGVIVLSTTSDPRFGDTRYGLRNVVRQQPPASLFEPPADYTVEFEAPPGAMRNGK